MIPSALIFLRRNVRLCIVALTLFSPISQASHFVPVGSGHNLIFVPNPSIDSVVLDNTVSQDNLVGIHVEGVSKFDNVYYRRHSLLNGQWLAENWQCKTGTDVNQTGNLINIDYVPNGLHHFEVGVCMSQTSCNDGWQAGVCSTSIKTSNVLVSEGSSATALATNNGELHLLWGQLAGVDSYYIEVLKNGQWYALSELNSKLGTVTPISYQTHIAENGYFNAGDLGDGFFSFRVSSCSQNVCSDYSNISNEVAIAPRKLVYSDKTIENEDGYFRAIDYPSMPGTIIVDIFPPKEKPTYYKITRTRNYMNNGEVYSNPAVTVYKLTETNAFVHNHGDGKTMLQFDLHSVEPDANYNIKVQACFGDQSLDLCGETEESPGRLFTYIQSNPVIVGKVSPYQLGSDLLRGEVTPSAAIQSIEVFIKNPDPNDSYPYLRGSKKNLHITDRSFSISDIESLLTAQGFMLPINVEVMVGASYKVNSTTFEYRTYSLGKIAINKYDNAEMLAINDVITVPKGKSTGLNLIGNDTLDEDPVNIVITSQPSAGSVYSNGLTVTYTPPNDYYSGTTSFTYRLEDSPVGHESAGKVSNTATVELTVEGNNTAPSASDDFAQVTVVLNATATSDVSGSERVMPLSTQSSGDVLFSFATDQQNSVSTNTITIDVLNNDSDADATDDLTIVPDNITGLNGIVSLSADKKRFYYTPTHEQVKDDIFYYRATDGKGGVSPPTKVDVKMYWDIAKMQPPMVKDNVNGGVTVSWPTNTNMQYYKVRYQSATQDWITITLNGDESSTLLDYLELGTYHFQISACRYPRCSPWSNSATHTVTAKSLVNVYEYNSDIYLQLPASQGNKYIKLSTVDGQLVANVLTESEWNAVSPNFSASSYVVSQFGDFSEDGLEDFILSSADGSDTYTIAQNGDGYTVLSPVMVEYKYDALGRLTEVIDSKRGSSEYNYDPAGNRTNAGRKEQ